MATDSAAASASLVSASREAAPLGLVQALAATGDQLRARTGHLLVAAGTNTDDVYIVLEGQLRVTIFSMDGREVIMRHQGAGVFLVICRHHSARPPADGHHRCRAAFRSCAPGRGKRARLGHCARMVRARTCHLPMRCASGDCALPEG